ncbi:MAG: hypothetical protein ACQESG_05660 [Nanobdellota archaeon]
MIHRNSHLPAKPEPEIRGASLKKAQNSEIQQYNDIDLLIPKDQNPRNDRRYEQRGDLIKARYRTSLTEVSRIHRSQRQPPLPARGQAHYVGTEVDTDPGSSKRPAATQPRMTVPSKAEGQRMNRKSPFQGI